MDKVYSRKETAQMLGITVKTLDELRKRRYISYIQMMQNGRVFFTEEAINEYVARGYHRAAPIEQRDSYRRARSGVCR